MFGVVETIGITTMVGRRKGESNYKNEKKGLLFGWFVFAVADFPVPS